jgi:hypothetical protein
MTGAILTMRWKDEKKSHSTQKVPPEKGMKRYRPDKAFIFLHPRQTMMMMAG